MHVTIRRLASAVALVALIASSARCGASVTPGTAESAARAATVDPSQKSAPATSAGATSTPREAATCPIATMTGPNATPADLQHPTGTWFGMAIDWGSETVADVSSQLGPAHTPAAWVYFAGFPIQASDRANLDGFYAQVRSVGGIAVLTLQPNGGLATVTEGAADGLARLLATYRDCGVSTLVRFAHEMNGTWYPWGQDPAAYVRAFRLIAAAVHQLAPGNAMMWAPNNGDGYPFAVGPYEAKPGTAAFAALDTNHDGRLTSADDPYAPYWPGDDAVDWVGMSLYHWGNSYPWGANVVPPPTRFADLLTGHRGVAGGFFPNFYATYAVGHHKPLAIVETAAFWRPDAAGASELAIKQAWWRQVFSAATADEFPQIRLIGWFEWRKFESEVNDVVDWRLAAEPQLVRQFLANLPVGRLRFSPASGT